MSSSQIVDIAIAMTAVEGLVLVLLWWRTGKGVVPGSLATILFSGLPLMAAIRLALGDARPGWIVLCLIAALLAHLADLGRRWKS